jgi:hypothetical protein
VAVSLWLSRNDRVRINYQECFEVLGSCVGLPLEEAIARLSKCPGVGEVLVDLDVGNLQEVVRVSFKTPDSAGLLVLYVRNETVMSTDVWTR